MLGNPGCYANKKRKKPVLKQKKISAGNDVVKSNPSKRHRDRLNGELDRLTDLLPFPDETRSRLDKLSVLRLSVGYLRVKSFFRATAKSSNDSLMVTGKNGHNGNSVDMAGISEGDLLLQALNGFVIVVTLEGSVFYVSPTIEEYLGFHQSDVIHQSVFELIHTDDRAMFRQQLHFAMNENVLQSSDNTVMYNPEHLPPENSSFLERCFVCRFRCLLDNSSGFLPLKFQGRLKYLHGQKLSRDNGTCNKPQLALFTIATPVQHPSIVEIRAKMLLFQSKHKLDFTPMGIDSRGKVILGYSETELCMKGSGYQFIHAADMMYCADNHIRMIKTGESGLTVFRLLSKSGGWVWVKANAKLIYKGGRPEFIIAYQRALVKAEGEEYLRQRRLQLPFSFTTGEGVLYNLGPTMDVSQFQMDKMFQNPDPQSSVNPGSLIDCFLKQDEAAYTKVVDPPLPVDDLFMDSQALVSVPTESGAMGSMDSPMVVKEETRHSAMTMIDNLEKMAQSGDLCSVLQDLDVADSELVEWENALKRLSQNEEPQNNVSSELDSVLTNDLFDYVESVLFKEKGEDCLNASPPSCLTALSSTQPEPLGLFHMPSPNHTFPKVDDLYSQHQDALNGAAVPRQSLTKTATMFNSSYKLSHPGPTPPAVPPPQVLQLPDIFSSSIDIPPLTVPGPTADGDSALFQSCSQASGSHMTCPQDITGQLLQNSLQAPTLAPTLGPTGGLLHSSVKQPNHVAPRAMDILPPLIPCSDFNSSNIPIPFATASLQDGPPVETHAQPWQQQQQQKLAHPSHELLTACHSQSPESQTFPRAGLWPRLSHLQQGRLACGQAAAHSSCMFQQHFSAGPGGGNVLALSSSSDLRGADLSVDQSPPQGSCYFQWSHSEPVVGTSVIQQENANISPVVPAPSAPFSEHSLNIQQYLDHHRHAQVNMPHCALDHFTPQDKLN